MRIENARVVLILSGGVGLGAYQGGAYAAFANCTQSQVDWVAGSSGGAVNAAIIAGNAPCERPDRLRQLWQIANLPADEPRAASILGFTANWANAIQTRMWGSPGFFVPRSQPPWGEFGSLYDLKPLQARLKRLVDFERLNSGEVRFTAAATDALTGELVLFDNRQGDRIDVEHLMASCGFFPEFAPVEIGGRVLGDGGLAANAPIEALLLEEHKEHTICFVIDLYARDGDMPVGLERAFTRKSDIIFGNQTWQRLAAFRREQTLRTEIAKLKGEEPCEFELVYLSYRPSGEKGPDRAFDFSARNLDRRWIAGELDMQEALRLLSAHRTKASLVDLTAVRRATQNLQAPVGGSV